MFDCQVRKYTANFHQERTKGSGSGHARVPEVYINVYKVLPDEIADSAGFGEKAVCLLAVCPEF